MHKAVPKCWICGNDGDTGEHKSKRSDLRSVFGTPSQTQPLYLHDGRRKNRCIGSLDAKVLKSPSRLCANCNNSRTQPHDRAWERMSGWLRTRRPAITPGTIVRANRIFPYDTAREMLNVHLYFAKLFGCHILEGAMPIDIETLADAILREVAHPGMYLKFGCSSSLEGHVMVGMSDVHLQTRPSDGSCAFATWLYEVDNLVVNVMYAAPGERREGLINAWHPKLGTNRLAIADFR